MKKITFIASIFFCFMLMVFLSTCRHSILPSPQLSLPPWPPSTQNKHLWPELDFWEIHITTPDSQTVYHLPPDTRNFTVSENYNTCISIEACPVTKGITFFHPAGAILPWNKTLTWENGFNAELLRKLYLSSMDYNNSRDIKNFAAGFNWPLLENRLYEKQIKSGIFYNPWLLDQNVIVSKIISKSFNQSSLSLKNVQEVHFEREALSSYIPENFGNGGNVFILKKNTLEKFLLREEENDFYIMTATVNSKGTLSLAINSLPL